MKDTLSGKKQKTALKYGFCNNSFRRDEPRTSCTFLQYICPHFWAWLLLYSAITPKIEDKYVVKVFNSSEFHLSEMTLLQNPYFNTKVQDNQTPNTTLRKTKLWTWKIVWHLSIWTAAQTPLPYILVRQKADNQGRVADVFNNPCA